MRKLINSIFRLASHITVRIWARGFIMKKATLLACLLAAFVIAGTAVPVVMAGKNDAVRFPDARLKQALLDSGADVDGDGELTEGEMAALTGLLDLSGKSVKDLTGLSNAENITELNLSGNAIADIKVLSAMDKLIALDLSDNQLLDIKALYDINNLPDEWTLQTLDVSGNYLSVADGSSARGVIDKLLTAGVAVRFDPQKPIPAMDVELNAKEIDMCPGDTATLSAAVLPEGAVNQNVFWHSEEPAAALVADGVITAVAPGQAVITVTAEDGGWTDTCLVVVKPSTLSSDVYTLNGSILYAAPLTTAERFLENLNNDTGDVALQDANGKDVMGRNVVTGMAVKLTVGGIERDSRTVIVKGDLTGDGVVSIKDYTMLNLHLRGLKSLDSVYAFAADYDGDGQISDADADGMRQAFADTKMSGEGLSGLPDVDNPQLRAFLDAALAQLSKPYVWGARGPNSFDCSGFVYYCLRQAGYDVERVTADMYSRFKQWKYVDKDDLQPGDIMFYYSDDKNDGDRMGHTGIYLGNGYHIHASSDYGCIIICGVQGWYKSSLAFGRRVFE